MQCTNGLLVRTCILKRGILIVEDCFSRKGEYYAQKKFVVT